MCVMGVGVHGGHVCRDVVFDAKQLDWVQQTFSFNLEKKGTINAVNAKG